ncbi:MAG TPA: hypothetical protein VNO51_07430, partial [Ilumatobacteraceae bacterium]|nr:hypothetical protein [Ilumatobacteraceae bacterium]
MRRTAIAALLVGGLLVTACGDDDTDSTDTADTAAPGGTAAPSDTTAPDDSGATCAEGKTLTAGTLTIATGEPAFEPWVV